jgi:hypothetical protein
MLILIEEIICPKIKELKISIRLFTRLWVKTIKDFGPPDWPNITWYDGKQKFSSGEFGFYPDCDFFAANYGNPAKSSVAGRPSTCSPIRRLEPKSLSPWAIRSRDSQISLNSR